VAHNLARLRKEIPMLAMPDNGSVVIDGQRFVGGTMWFRRDPTSDMYKRFMSDFSLIRDFEPWVYDQNVAFEKVLALEVQAEDVVVTHHLPAPESIAPRFARSALNAFFLCDASSLLRERRPSCGFTGIPTIDATISWEGLASWRIRSDTRTSLRASRPSRRGFWCRSSLALPPGTTGCLTPHKPSTTGFAFRASCVLAERREHLAERLGASRPRLLQLGT
jgi:hypothetical protein